MRLQLHNFAVFELPHRGRDVFARTGKRLPEDWA